MTWSLFKPKKSPPTAAPKSAVHLNGRRIAIEEVLHGDGVTTYEVVHYFRSFPHLPDSDPLSKAEEKQVLSRTSGLLYARMVAKSAKRGLLAGTVISRKEVE